VYSGYLGSKSAKIDIASRANIYVGIITMERSLNFDEIEKTLSIVK
jgi:hypothetical protein